MTLTLSNAILVESFFKVTVGVGSTITTEQLSLLESGVSGDVSNFIGNRVISDDIKTRITACFILDLYANKGGKGTVVQESFKESSWKSNIRTSSQYMDRAHTLRDNIDTTDYKFASSGVTRSDAYSAIEYDKDVSKFLFG
ncbi:MAG: hypothetical protein ABFD07_14260 [Methanobacterium sp.]